MQDYIVLLKVARAELDTIIEYTELLNQSEDAQDITSTLDEIRGDEFNHALISMLLAAKSMGIKIATDDISPNPNGIEVKQ